MKITVNMMIRFSKKKIIRFPKKKIIRLPGKKKVITSSLPPPIDTISPIKKSYYYDHDFEDFADQKRLEEFASLNG